MESQSGCRHDGSLGKDSETLRKFRNLPYHLGVYSGAPGDFEEELQYFASQVESAAGGLIDAAIFQLELQADPGETEETEAAAATHTVATGPIFVVHGRDDGRKLMRLLDRTAIESHPVVLHEQPNGGATILEKFERHAQRASCAVVLLTGDDEGHLRRHDGPLSPPGPDLRR